MRKRRHYKSLLQDGAGGFRRPPPPRPPPGTGGDSGPQTAVVPSDSTAFPMAQLRPSSLVPRPSSHSFLGPRPVPISHSSSFFLVFPVSVSRKISYSNHVNTLTVLTPSQGSDRLWNVLQQGRLSLGYMPWTPLWRIHAS